MGTTATRRWRVVGVDNDTGYETSIVFQASSAAVAKLMAERKGMAVAMVSDLEAEEIEEVRREVNASIPDDPTPARRSPRPGEIICPNPHCGFVGQPKKVRRGSTLLFVILALFLLVPAVIYAIFTRGYRYLCPRCGVVIRSDVN